jgi:hypothetical protein
MYDMSKMNIKKVIEKTNINRLGLLGFCGTLAPCSKVNAGVLSCNLASAA